MKVSGMGDFEGDKTAVTQYYVCSKCNRPCDRALPEAGLPEKLDDERYLVVTRERKAINALIAWGKSLEKRITYLEANGRER